MEAGCFLWGHLQRDLRLFVLGLGIDLGRDAHSHLFT